MRTGFNALYFSSVGWDWAKQRPHFMAEYLAKQGIKVTYCAMRHSLAGPNRRTEGNIEVVEPYLLRGYMRTPIVCSINRHMLSHSITAYQYDKVILTNPIQLDLLPASLTQKPIFYDCMDYISEFYTGNQKKIIQACERRLCRTAKSIFVSSDQIGNHLSRDYNTTTSKIITVNNAYSPDAVDDAPMAFLKTPNIVYVGTISKWLDIEVLELFCHNNPDYTIYLVGPASRDVQRRLKTAIPRCILTGPLPHRQAMSYIKGACVVVVPFIRSELIDLVDPVKNYEYIALGKPVVTSDWPALKHFRKYENMHFYQDAASFEQQILSYRGKTYPVPESFEQENGWAARAAQVMHELEHE